MSDGSARRRPRRVAITLPSSRTGGIARYGWNLVAALHARPDVALVPVGDTSALADAHRTLGLGGGIAVPASAIPQAAAIRHRLGRRLAEERVDVFHGLKHVVPASRSIPSVLTAHDDFLFTRASDYPLAKRALLPPLYRASLRRADAVISVSDVTATSMQALGLRAELATVRHPFESDLAQAVVEPVDALADGRPFALFVGEWLPRKNLDLLVRIWPAVFRVTGALLVIAGPRRGAEDTLAAVDRAVAAGHALALGRVSDGGLRWLYETAAITCVPSREEGWGLPVSESLSLRTAVLAGTHPALVEAGGGASMHLDLADEAGWTRVLVAALGGPKVRPPASRDQGRGWEQVAAEVADHYRRLVSGLPAGERRRQR